MFQWLRNLFHPKPPVKDLPPRRELVQWLPGANLWVPFSANYWQDRGYPRSVAWMLYREGVEMADELGFSRSRTIEQTQQIAKESKHGTYDRRPEPARESDYEPDLTSQANLLLAAGEALCDAGLDHAGRPADTGGYTGHGGDFGGAGATGSWEGGDAVPSHAAEVAAPAPDLSPSVDAGPSIDTSSSISDTSSFDSSGNC